MCKLETESMPVDLNILAYRVVDDRVDKTSVKVQSASLN